jgi:hypothetical protein
MIKRETEKILQFKDLTIEIQRMLNAKTKVISIIIWETGTISISFGNYLKNILGNHEIKELQKAAMFGIAYVLQKELTKKYRTFNMGSNITCTINFNYRKAVDRFRWQHDLRSWSAAHHLLELRV